MNSWDNIFRSLFNIPRMPHDHSDEWVFIDDHSDDYMNEDDHDHDHFCHHHDHDHDNDADPQDSFSHHGSFHFGFTEPDDMFRHFNQIVGEMFKDLGVAEFPSMERVPSIEVPNQPTSPRDFMLKDKQDRSPDSSIPVEPHLPEKHSIFGNLWRTPHWDRIRPQDKVDKELDSEDKSILDDIVKGSKDSAGLVPHQQPPNIQSSSKSVSIKTICRPDGSVEHMRTVRGSDGTDETTVTRSVDDKSHTVTTVKTKDGEEKKESFTNLDENDLGKFNSLWSKGSSNATNSANSDSDIVVTPRLEERDEETRSIFKSLFGFSSPGFKKT